MEERKHLLDFVFVFLSLVAAIAAVVIVAIITMIVLLYTSPTAPLFQTRSRTLNDTKNSVGFG